MYDVKVVVKDLGWTPSTMAGVDRKHLFKDETTGAMTVLTRMAPGTTIAAHWHSQADEKVFIMEGDFEEDGVTYGPGSYFVAKAGTAHGPHKTVSGCIMLTHFSAELDRNLIH